jgi:hypothetical protein
MAKAFKNLPTGVARAAVGHMPFPGSRNCAQWKPPTAFLREMTDKQRLEDAERGSANLLEAIRKAAA